MKNMIMKIFAVRDGDRRAKSGKDEKANILLSFT
jgi:hypothetical protein